MQIHRFLHTPVSVQTHISLFHSSSIMFSSLCNSNVSFQNKVLLKLNFNGRNSTQTTTTTSTLCFLTIRPRSISISSTTTNETSTTVDDTTTNNKSIFTISYLVNSCGLSEEKATTISKIKKFHLKTTTKPDSVLTLLRNYGFNDTHISIFVLKHPPLLLADPDKTLKPKLEFFHSIGLHSTELADFICMNPKVLCRSLDNQIKPSVTFLKTIVHTYTNLVKVLKRSTWVLERDLQKHLAPKIALLQAHGVPDSNICTLITSQPRSLSLNIERLDEVIKEVKEMGFDSSKVQFVFAIYVFVSMKKSVLEGKFEIYRKWGWSEEEIHTAFVKHPNCLRISKNKISCTMEVLVNKMGYDPSKIAHFPIILNYSLEKRIIPRCSVLQILIMKGLVKKDHNIGTAFVTTEKYFLKNFVTKFENEVPNLFDVYLENMNSLELPGWHEEVDG